MQRSADLLSREFHKTKRCHINKYGLHRVCCYSAPQCCEKCLPALLFLHINKVHNNDPGEIPETELDSDLPRRFQICLQVVSSDVFFETLLAVFTSMTVSASVGSITRFPPDFNQTVFESAWDRIVSR